MTTRQPCRTPGCAGTILPSTSERTGGLCMPCVQRAAAEAHARDVAARRIDVDRFAGVTDVVEIVTRIHRPPRPDPLVHLVPYRRSVQEVYAELGQRDADRLVAACGDTELLRVVAAHLAAFADVDLGPTQRALVERWQSYPASVFRGATRPIVDRLFELLASGVERSDLMAVDHALSALAWTRSDHVVEEMVAWSRRAPPWRAMLHLAPEEYTMVAGFCIEEGQVRELVLPEAFRIVVGGAEDGSSPLSVFERDPRGDACPTCGSRPTLLFAAAGNDLPVELRARVPSRAPTCVACAPYGATFVRLSAGGGFTWLTSDAVPPSADGWSAVPTRASLAPRRPWEVVGMCTRSGLSQLGGHPSWSHDFHYPECPGCGRRMPTVAQIGGEDIPDGPEGVFHVHHCAECAVVGVSYQQS